MRIGSQEIQFRNAFQLVTTVMAKDCLVGESTISFLVEEGKMGVGIGKDGVNVKKLRKILKKNIELFEQKKTPEEFVGNAFSNVSFSGFETLDEEGQKILIAKATSEEKRKLLNDLGKMKRVKEIVKRNYKMDDIRIGR